MKVNRIIAYLIGCLALASAFLVYMGYIYQLGFPDGFITELGYAERKLAYIFIGISIILGSFFIYLGMAGARRLMGKQLSITVILYVVFMVGIYLIDYYYHQHLDNGAGG